MEEYSIASTMLRMEAKRAAVVPMGEGTLAEARGEFENVNVGEFISLELGAPNRVFTTKENDRRAFCSRLIVSRGALRVLTAQEIRQRAEFRERITRPVRYSPAQNSSRLGF